MMQPAFLPFEPHQPILVSVLVLVAAEAEAEASNSLLLVARPLRHSPRSPFFIISLSLSLSLSPVFFRHTRSLSLRLPEQQH